MRSFLAGLAVVAALFSGTWLVLAKQVEDRARAALDALSSQGWDVSYEDLDADGFPTELALSLIGLRVEGEVAPVTWDAPSLRLSVPVARPNRLDAELPPEQTVTVAGEAVAVGSDRLGMEATVGLSAGLPLEGTELRGDALKLTGGTGWEVTAGSVAGRASRDGAAYDLTLGIGGLGLSGLSAGFADLSLRGRVTLDRPVALREGSPPRLLELRLDEARVTQGDVALSARGDLRPDARGYLSGRVTLAVENWRALLDLLETSGLLPFDRRALAEGAFEGLSGGSDRVEVPVTFENGRVQALGIDLLAAPRLL